VASDDAVHRLPATYQQVMAWLDAGVPADEIAARLDIEPSAVPALIDLTRAKFARASDEARKQGGS
jgi:DNA-directed RNA polymerase specialized sigma24 family protein